MKRNTWLAAIILFAALALSPVQTHPQGCAQCRDNTAATSPKTQAAYRHAIILMTVTAGALFLTSVVLLRRHR